MKFIDFFAGIGGFRRGLELAGHECVGFCEFDKFAVASYTSMHLLTEEQRQYLETLPLKQRQKEILKEEYKNGEWYASDIRAVRAIDIPKADCWCFGFPCQDISIAGKQLGFAGKRSSLFFAVTSLIRDLKEEDRPSYLLIENVKNLLSVNRGFDFAKLLIELDEIGYDAEWQVLNSKEFGVPQNRERIFIIGHLRGRCTRKVFPIGRTASENNCKQLIGGSQAQRVYDPSGTSCTLSSGGGGLGARTGLYVTKETTKLAIPVMTPDRTNMRQNGRRLKNDGEEMFTLTTVARHGVMVSGNTNPSGNGMNGNVYDSRGVAPTLTTNKGEGIKVNVNTQIGYDVAKEGDTINFAFPDSKTRRGRVGKGVAQTLTTSCNQGILRGYRIRRLTPKECFRLQGWTDDYFEKAQFVNSDNQLYRQAGNGVTVNVIKTIGESLNTSEPWKGEQE